MKKSALTLLLTSTLLVMTSCSSSNLDNAKNTIAINTDLAQNHEDYLSDIANFRIETGGQIEDNDRRIAEIKADCKDKKKASVLEERNNTLKMKLDHYKLQGKEQWEVFKAQFNSNMIELQKSVKGLISNN